MTIKHYGLDEYQSNEHYDRLMDQIRTFQKNVSLIVVEDYGYEFLSVTISEDLEEVVVHGVNGHNNSTLLWALDGQLTPHVSVALCDHLTVLWESAKTEKHDE